MPSAAAAAGRLDQALAAAAGISRAQAQVWLDAGCVSVNGTVITKAARRLHGGESLDWTEPPPRPSGVSAEVVPLTVLYEDDLLIAVDKPAGMITHPAPGVHSGTLVNALLGRGPLPGATDDFGPEGYRPGIVHRLDRDTSGVIVVAKTVAAQARLAAAFKARDTRKQYLAITVGAPPAPVVVNAPIGRHPTRKICMAVNGVGARDAETRVDLLARAPGRQLSSGVQHALVLAQPRTGRTHQIRVHLAALGTPILGDSVYGRPSVLIGRQALHAWRLDVPHPSGFGRLRLEASPPADLLLAWNALGGLWPELPGWEPLPGILTES